MTVAIANAMSAIAAVTINSRFITLKVENGEGASTLIPLSVTKTFSSIDDILLSPYCKVEAVGGCGGENCINYFTTNMMHNGGGINGVNTIF
jgi:hypothetical protein